MSETVVDELMVLGRGTSSLSSADRCLRRRPLFVACVAFVVDGDNCCSCRLTTVATTDRLFVVNSNGNEALGTTILSHRSSSSSPPQLQSTGRCAPVFRYSAAADEKQQQLTTTTTSCCCCCLIRAMGESLRCTAKRVLHLDMDAEVGGWVSEQVKHSPETFRRFLLFSCSRSKQSLQRNSFPSDHSPLTFSSGHLLVVHLTFPLKMWLDYLWSYRLESLITKQLMLDDLMNWLSTLGGAYSSLGDYFTHHAENAAKISLKQLRVAVEMNCPPFVIRCRLFYALSLMQTQQLRRAKNLIRRQYRAAKALPVEDEQLLNMCKGIWSRLRYLWLKRKGQSIASS